MGLQAYGPTNPFFHNHAHPHVHCSIRSLSRISIVLYAHCPICILLNTLAISYAPIYQYLTYNDLEWIFHVVAKGAERVIFVFGCFIQCFVLFHFFAQINNYVHIISLPFCVFDHIKTVAINRLKLIIEFKRQWFIEKSMLQSPVLCLCVCVCVSTPLKLLDVQT